MIHVCILYVYIYIQYVQVPQGNPFARSRFSLSFRLARTFAPARCSQDGRQGVAVMHEPEKRQWRDIEHQTWGNWKLLFVYVFIGYTNIISEGLLHLFGPKVISYKSDCLSSESQFHTVVGYEKTSPSLIYSTCLRVQNINRFSTKPGLGGGYDWRMRLSPHLYSNIIQYTLNVGWLIFDPFLVMTDFPPGWLNLPPGWISHSVLCWRPLVWWFQPRYAVNFANLT